MIFIEEKLEQAVIEIFSEEGYKHLTGEHIHKEINKLIADGFVLKREDRTRKELDRQFKNAESNFKISMVVDMWLTGFDVSFLDTIYIDKSIQQHSLIQTISRVNRVYEGKEAGLVVDYIGIKSNMNVALKKYSQVEEDDF